jgi:anti-sigma regulatory factor (Ser/Thr protein kinase)
MSHAPCSAPARPDAIPGPSPARTRTPAAQRPRTTRLEMRAASTAPGRARAFLRAALAGWGLAALTDDAEAITSELVTNGITASQQAAPAGITPAPVWLTITDATAELFIDVWDPSPEPPTAGHVCGTWDENGRGLLIVKALSHRWAWYHLGHGGKVVWAAILTSPLAA